jgi:spermidine synthase
MLTTETIDRARLSDGTELVLARRGNEWMIHLAGRVLMSSRLHASERALATASLERRPEARAVLVGGLGLGYTLRAVLERLAPDATVTVAELVPELVSWNRTHLRGLHDDALADPRCRVALGDVLVTLEGSPSTFDVVLLDVDNGPVAMTQPENQRLYSASGLQCCYAALKPGGVLTVWSAGPSRDFERRLSAAGFAVHVQKVPARLGAGGRHVLFVASRKAPHSSLKR